MESISEKSFMINGIKSWIQCIEMTGVPKLEKGTPSRYHFHDYIELLYAVDAHGYVWCSGKKICFDSGNLIIVNSNTPHTLTFESASTYFCVKFSPQILYADETSLFEFKYMLPFLSENSVQWTFRRDEIKNTDMEAQLLEIMNEWKTQKPAYELIIRANILKLFAGIIRYLHENNIISNEIKITDTLKKALIYIEENFDTVTENDVAEYCHTSYNYFSSVFKKTIGKSFSEYITFLRISKAEKLLLLSDKSITDIAVETGFSTSSYFISKFKAYKGVTPGKFRKNIGNILVMSENNPIH